MKLKRKQVLGVVAAITALEKGKGENKPYDIDWKTWDKFFKIMLAFQDVSEAYNKARKLRFLKKSDGEPELKEPKAQQDFINEEEEIMDQVISVRLPKERIKQADLKLDVNKIPPSILVQLNSIIEWDQVSETDMEGEDDY